MTMAKASVFAATFAENCAFIWMSVTEFLSLSLYFVTSKTNIGNSSLKSVGLYLGKKSTLQHCKTLFGMLQHPHKPLKIFAE